MEFFLRKDDIERRNRARKARALRIGRIWISRRDVCFLHCYGGLDAEVFEEDEGDSGSTSRKVEAEEREEACSV